MNFGFNRSDIKKPKCKMFNLGKGFYGVPEPTRSKNRLQCDEEKSCNKIDFDRHLYNWMMRQCFPGTYIKYLIEFV